MLALLISLLGGLACATISAWTLKSSGWTLFIGFAGFMAVLVPLNLWLKKQLEAVFNTVQSTLQASQDVLRRKVNNAQRGFSGSPKALQKLLEKEQAESIRAAVAELDKAVPLYRWNMLAERQTNILRAQLYFQLREFEAVDKCLAKCLVLDPMTLALKLTRLHMREEKEAFEKQMKKGLKKFKDDKCLLLYALYSWVLVKDNRIDEAVTVLAKGKDVTKNEVIKANWEHLANGRIRQFSNANLGEQWYALQLETPKAVKVVQPRGGGFGGRFR